MTSNVLYRWVGESAIRSYIKNDRMTARTLHYIPKELSGLTKSRVFRGISFSSDPSRWSMDYPVCFVLNKNKIPNDIVKISGDAIYTLSQQVSYFKDFSDYITRNDWENLKKLEQNAISESKTEPNEDFLIGSLENMTQVLSKLIVRGYIDSKLYSLIEEYSNKNNIIFQANR